MKKNLSKVDLYKRNQKKSKIIKFLVPIFYWGCLICAIICLVYAVRNSFGNIAEITDLLDTKKYTGEQLKQNYSFLIEKYGEWIIGNGNGGFQIKFINISKALFSGLMITNIIGTIVFAISSKLFGRWLMPLWAKKIEQSNQDMTNLVILANEDEKK